MQPHRAQQGVVTEVKRGKGIRLGVGVEFPLGDFPVFFGRNELAKVE